MEENVIRLGGRQFAGISQDISAAQDEYLMGHMRRAGCVEALMDPALPEEKRAEEVLTRILLSGETFHILAGYLTEPSKKWTRAEAERNATAFAALTDRESKMAMNGIVVGFVLGFFGSGAKSQPTSQKSSGPTSAESPIESAERATSEISPMPSAPSPDTTQTATAR